MYLEDAYRQKIEAQIEEQRAVAGGIMVCEELADADQKPDVLKAKLKDAGNASGDAWQEMKDGIERCLGRLARVGQQRRPQIQGKKVNHE